MKEDNQNVFNNSQKVYFFKFDNNLKKNNLLFIMSEESLVKSVFIDGDKSYFSSKGAVDRLKKDLKSNDQDKLKNSTYFKEGWTFEIVSQSEIEIKVKIVNVQDLKANNAPRVLECDERRNMLKMKLKNMTERNGSITNLKTKLKDKIPADLLACYLELKKKKLPVPLLDPYEVLTKKEEFKNIVFTMIKSFGNIKGNNNPIIEYYRLLWKYLDNQTLDTTLNTTLKKESIPVINNKEDNFIDQLRNERLKKAEMDAEEELKRIYASIGINTSNEEKNTNKEENTNKDEINSNKEEDDLNNLLKKINL